MTTLVLGRRWLRASLVYFVLVLALGVGMGIADDHRLLGVHAHLGLLGWVSSALLGLFYRALPAAAAGRLAVAQFWLFQASLPVMMAGLAGKLLGHEAMEPALGLGSLGVLLAGVLLLPVFWPRFAEPARP